MRTACSICEDIRKAKEDRSRLTGTNGSYVVYKVPSPASTIRVEWLKTSPEAGIEVSLSTDLREFSQAQPKDLDGIVEADETYIGGRKRGGKRGRGSENKTAVFGMLDRDDGIVVTSPVKRVNARTLKGMIESHVSSDSIIMTDEFKSYDGLDKTFAGHERVDHSSEEYARGDVHVNTLEGFWSLLKRGIIGIYHKVSVDHLHRYCDEFEYRYNSRKMKDSERFSKTLGKLNGRLTYKKLTAE